jgi:hypothetical protein
MLVLLLLFPSLVFGEVVVNRLETPKGIVIHHSSTRDTDSISYNAIRKYHVETMDWDEIGYHYIIESTKTGVNIFTGRGVQYEGAHTLGRNNMIGICVVGDYDSVSPTNAHVEALVRVLVAQLAMFPTLTLDDIHYHNETAPKTCPGLNFPTLLMLKAWVDVKRKYL